MAVDAQVLDELRRKRILTPASELDRPLERVPSGLAGLDRIAGGGLPRARVSELITGPAGGAILLGALLAGATGSGELAALVDPADGFDPATARRAGVDLARLLWVRPQDDRRALRAAELILEAGGFDRLVINRGGGPSRPGSAAAWMRLDRLARQREALVVVLGPTGVVGPFASLVVAIDRCRPRWAPAGAGYVVGMALSFSLRKRRRA